MAMVNGAMEHLDDVSVSSSHLGKRKRSASASPLKQTRTNEHAQPTLQQTLQDTLRMATKLDTVPSLLRYPLHITSPHERSPKRTRLSQATTGASTIESRIQTKAYDSFDALVSDVEEARDGILAHADSEQVNGKTASASQTSTNIKAQLAKLVAAITSLNTNPTSPIKNEKNGVGVKVEKVPEHTHGQVLHLCIQTEKGPRHLFSGLPVTESAGDKSMQVDGRKLPNGFDLADPATMNPSIPTAAKDKRVFGDVFRPHRNLKQLEAPRTQRTAYRSNKLDFTSDVDPNRPNHVTKLHYQHQSLPTGAWLQYTTSGSGNDPESKRRQREQTLAGTDYKTTLTATNTFETDADKANALFNSAFSSFAPTADNSKAAIVEQDRNRQWWHRAGHRKLASIFMPAETVSRNDVSVISDPTLVNEDEFESIVANFEPFDQEDIPSMKDDLEDVDDVLEEISSLLETLHSYQRIRTLDVRASLAASKPSNAEFDIYEMLRSQLSILIASLPPFALAKLDGDKLKDLNVSTNISVEPVDYVGTAQADDFTLRRYSAAQGVNSAPTRAVPANVPRPAYQTPAGITRYGSNVGAYGQNSAVPATTYGQRTAPAYQTPRPAATAATAPRPYPPQSYQPSTTSYGSQPTVQQFQRPIPNGYGSYNTPAQASYVPRPAQSTYQPRPQDATPTYGRSVSPNKSLVNGQPLSQTTQPQPPYQRTSSQPLTPAQQYATTDQRAMMERAKAYQQQSGTPNQTATNGVPSEPQTVEATR